MDGKRFYWLKLKKDFFKRHDIRILEGLENGHEYVLFYLKLLCESIDHDGQLRFSAEVPYDDDMLAAVTGTRIDIVKNGMQQLYKLGLAIKAEDNTIIMHKACEMVGSAVDNDNANRQRRFRDKNAAGVMQPLQNVTHTVTKYNAGVTHTVTKNNESIEIEKEKEIDIELELNKIKAPQRRGRSFVKPSIEEVEEYCRERKNGIDAQAFCDFYEAKGWKVGNTPMKDWKACMRTWEQRQKTAAAQLPAGRWKDPPTLNEAQPKEERTGTWDGETVLQDWQKQRLAPEERDRYEKWFFEQMLGD